MAVTTENTVNFLFSNKYKETCLKYYKHSYVVFL